MPNYALLITFLLCDGADDAVTRKLLKFQNKDQNADFSGVRTGWSVEARNARLADVDAEIASATAVLGLANITDEKRDEEGRKLRNAQNTRLNLLDQPRTTDAAEQFVAEEEAEAVQARVDKLLLVKAGIATQRATCTS